MLSRAFEWYRVASPRPTSQTVDNRTASAQDIIKIMDDADKWDIVLGCIAGVVSGFDSFSQESPVVQTILSSVKAHESAFPSDLSENSLALRACAAIALGEILVRHGDDQPEIDALMIASALSSGFGVRPAQKGKHLRQLIDELIAAATKVLRIGGLKRRERIKGLAERMENVAAPTELGSAWKVIGPALQDMTRQAEVNQEELDILWWLVSGLSSTTGKGVAELTAGAAALCCGVELANQSLLPPASSAEAVVRRGFEASRKPQDLAEKPVDKIAADWEAGLPAILVPNEDSKELATKYPSIFPLSWLCHRLVTNPGAKGWSPEYQRATGLASSQAWPSSTWAIQAFRERASQRFYNEIAST